MDDEVIGFGVQVRETGRKSFTLDYMFEDGAGVSTLAIFPIGRRRRLANMRSWIASLKIEDGCMAPGLPELLRMDRPRVASRK
jgi:hypothetical protein